MAILPILMGVGKAVVTGAKVAVQVAKVAIGACKIAYKTTKSLYRIGKRVVKKSKNMAKRLTAKALQSNMLKQAVPQVKQAVAGAVASAGSHLFTEPPTASANSPPPTSPSPSPSPSNPEAGASTGSYVFSRPEDSQATEPSPAKIEVPPIKVEIKPKERVDRSTRMQSVKPPDTTEKPKKPTPKALPVASKVAALKDVVSAVKQIKKN